MPLQEFLRKTICLFCSLLQCLMETQFLLPFSSQEKGLGDEVKETGGVEW
jgi:hypothetical protein